MKKITVLLGLCMGLNGGGLALAKERIISTSAYITQIAVELGQEKNFVGLDTTSRYNDTLNKFPDVGYRIALSTEGMLSLKPTLVLWSSESGPVAVVDQVRGSGVPSVTFQKPSNVAELKVLVTEMATLFKEEEKGQKINAGLDQHYEALNAAMKKRGQVNTLFLMEEMGGKGSKSFAGRETSANTLIEMLGLNNPFAPQFTAYKSVNLEAQIQQGAEIVLIGKRKNFSEQNQPIVRRDASVLGWPNKIAPKCVFEVDISHLLVYGIYLYDDAMKLNAMIDECLSVNMKL